MYRGTRKPVNVILASSVLCQSSVSGGEQNKIFSLKLHFLPIDSLLSVLLTSITPP